MEYSREWTEQRTMHWERMKTPPSRECMYQKNSTKMICTRKYFRCEVCFAEKIFVARKFFPEKIFLPKSFSRKKIFLPNIFSLKNIFIEIFSLSKLFRQADMMLNKEYFLLKRIISAENFKLLQLFVCSTPPVALTPDARYDKMMEAFGGRGYFVHTLESLTSALDECNRHKNLALINVMIDPMAQRKPQVR